MRQVWGIIVGLGLATAVALAAHKTNFQAPAAQDGNASQQTPEQGKGPSEQTPRETKGTGDAPARSEGKPETKSTTTSPPRKRPKKVVVREGGASEPSAQIVTSMSAEKASAERQEAEKWLGSAEEDLKELEGRTLNPQQQEAVSQIHNYISGAHSALTEGDISRGHTLATKARLLAEDLVKH